MDMSGFGDAQVAAPFSDTHETNFDEVVDAKGYCEEPLPETSEVLNGDQNLEVQGDGADTANEGGPASGSEAADLAASIQLAEDIEAAEKEVDQHVYLWLASVFRYAKNHLASKDAQKRFCAAHGISCTAATLKNPFLPIIKVTRPKASDQSSSRHARALQHAQAKRIEPERIAIFLGEEGGIAECARRVSKRENASSLEAPLSSRKAREAKKNRVTIVVPEEDGNYCYRILVRNGSAILDGLVAQPTQE